jgi:hypothetical protein
VNCCRRSAGTALLASIASVFTKETIDLAKAAFEQVAAGFHAEAQPAVAAAPAQPTAQVVYLPSQDDGSGIKLHTNTPVNIGAPINVDTPVQQDNVQIKGSLLGRRRLV